MTYIYFSDPGHGWLRVPLDHLAGIDFSKHSYTDGTYAYLEEDSDASVWLQAAGKYITITENGQDSGPSFIRQLPTLEGNAWKRVFNAEEIRIREEA